jgi:Flp pilus assembly protein TadD
MKLKSGKHGLVNMAPRCSSIMRLFCVTGLVILMTGCSTVSFQSQQIPSFQDAPKTVIEDVNVSAITPDIIDFLDRHIADDTSRSERAWALSHIAIDPYILGFEYRPELTLSAQEAFEKRQGNCLSFANLIIAMARHLGLRAHYQQVHIRPDWNSAGNTLLLSMHVNVVIETGSGHYVLDISGRKARELDLVTRMSADEARAQYFNNLGVDALLNEDLALAYGNLHRAISTDGNLSYLWSNLGVIFNRNGQTADAIWAYEVAMAKDGQNITASNNLFVIYERDGNTKAAASLLREVDRHQSKNPYHLMAQSQIAMEEQRYEDSVRLLKRAIKLKKVEYRLHAQLAMTYYLAGNQKEALNSFDQALALAPEDVELNFGEWDPEFITDEVSGNPSGP